MQQFCISVSTGNIVSKLTVNDTKNCKVSLGLTPRLAAVFARNHTCLPGPCLAQFFLMCNNIFPLFYQCRFFYFRDRPWRYILNFGCRYVPVVAFMQYFITNTVALTC